MAGVKGRSGGARPGSGPKPKTKAAESKRAPAKPPAEPMRAPDTDMLKLLQDVALGYVEATPTQVRAAIAAVQYTHVKKGDGGKKDEIADKAKQAGTGKFKAAPAPLKLVAGGK